MKQILPLFLLLYCVSAVAQNVGIGETAPADKLSVKGNLSVGSAYSTTAAPANGAIIQGNVGIGTTAPPAAFSVVYGTAGTNTYSGSAGNWYDPTNYAGYVQNNNNATSHYGFLVSDYWRSSENFLFGIDGRYYNNGTVSGDTHNPYLIVRGDGNVGIGTAAPSAQLHTTGTVLFANYPGGMLSTDASGNLQTRAIVSNNTNQIDLSNGSGVSGNPAINIDNAYAASVKAGFILSGGGNITYNGSAISWSTRFIVINNGTGPQFSTSGYFDITQPPIGTVITGAGSSGNVTVTASGVPLGCWDALYYILPIGSSNVVQNANYRIVQYGSGFVVPETWILIAAQNCDDGTVRVGNGAILQSGQTWTSGGGTAQNSGNGNYIENQNSAAQSANSWISGTSEAGTLTSTGEVYVQNWFRNNQAGTGLYNQVTGSGIYSPSANLMTLYNASSLEITSAATTAGNLRFDAANPYITASSYFVAPGGAYFSSGTVYTQGLFEARGGVENDQAAYLTLNGGTSNITYVNGSLGIGTSTPGYTLQVTGSAKVLNNFFYSDYNGANVAPAVQTNAGALAISGNWSSGNGETDFWNVSPNVGSNRGFWFWALTGTNSYTTVVKMNQTGNMDANGYSTFSDERLKENILPLTADQSDKIFGLKTYSYKFDKKAMESYHMASDDYLHFGVLAQELETLYPNIVHTDEQGVKSVNYIELIPVMIETLKSQNEKIKTLQSLADKVAILEKEIRGIKEEKH